MERKSIEAYSAEFMSFMKFCYFTVMLLGVIFFGAMIYIAYYIYGQYEFTSPLHRSFSLFAHGFLFTLSLKLITDALIHLHSYFKTLSYSDDFNYFNELTQMSEQSNEYRISTQMQNRPPTYRDIKVLEKINNIKKNKAKKINQSS